MLHAELPDVPLVDEQHHRILFRNSGRWIWTIIEDGYVADGRASRINMHDLLASFGVMLKRTNSPAHNDKEPFRLITREKQHLARLQSLFDRAISYPGKFSDA